MGSAASQRIVHLQNLIDHPRTGAGERAAAQRVLDRILEKTRPASEPASFRRGGRHASLARIADLIHEDIVLARLRSGTGGGPQVAVHDPIGDIPPEVRITVETPFDAGISITIDNVPPSWGWVNDDGMQAVSPAFTALVDALAAIMSSYNTDGDGIEKRFFGRVRAGNETLAW